LEAMVLSTNSGLATVGGERAARKCGSINHMGGPGLCERL
jgi:hypothetical protein